MPRLVACMILLSGSLHAAEIEPLVLTEGLTNASLSPDESKSKSDSDLLQTAFEEGEPLTMTVAEPVGTICYEDYCRQCDCRSWTARVGFLHWRPDEDTNDGGGALFGGDLDYDAGFGPYASLIYHGGSADLEFIYFNVDDWNSGIQFGPLFQFTREADLENYEFNIKKEVIPQVHLLTGIRVVELDSQGVFDIGMGPGAINLYANNELIGWQIGAEAVWYQRGPFSVDTSWKGGIYHNDMESGYSIPAMGGVAIEQGDTSFLTDFWFNLNYQLTDNLALRGGYSLMYIDPVTFLSGASLFGGGFDDRDIFIHGLQVMLEVGI